MILAADEADTAEAVASLRTIVAPAITPGSMRTRPLLLSRSNRR
jgi:hypothetical protein